MSPPTGTSRGSPVVLILWLGCFAVMQFTFDGWQERGQAGDLFDAVNSLLSGLAFAAVFYAILLAFSVKSFGCNVESVWPNWRHRRTRQPKRDLLEDAFPGELAKS